MEISPDQYAFNDPIFLDQRFLQLRFDILMRNAAFPELQRQGIKFEFVNIPTFLCAAVIVGGEKVIRFSSGGARIVENLSKIWTQSATHMAWTLFKSRPLMKIPQFSSVEEMQFYLPMWTDENCFNVPSERLNISMVMALVMIDYLFLHEIAHHHHDHCTGYSNSFLDNHLMEFQADSYAAMMIMIKLKKQKLKMITDNNFVCLKTEELHGKDTTTLYVGMF